MGHLDEEKKQQIIDFILDHKDAYNDTPMGRDYYADRIEWEDYSSPPYISDFLIEGLSYRFEHPDVDNTYFNQLYSWFDCYPEGMDPYDQLLDKYEETYGPLKGKHIVEIGGGPVPALARKMAERMKDENGQIVGSITVYDPNYVETYPGITFIPRKFDDDTEIDPNSELIAMMPCEGTKPVLTRFTQQFQGMVQLCRCSKCQTAIRRDNPKYIVTRMHSRFSDTSVQIAYTTSDDFDSDESFEKSEGRSR
ncbi:MAG: hypothetical protein IKQ35_04370 [Bacilli bacterium]|nr:hypothetical protein [Bacilli bacterium]